jgi:hypothetical protein
MQIPLVYFVAAGNTLNILTAEVMVTLVLVWSIYLYVMMLEACSDRYAEFYKLIAFTF